MNSCNLGHRKKNKVGMNLLCRYHYIPAEEYNELKQRGRVLFQTLDKFNNIYADAIAKEDNELLPLLETGILRSRKIGALHRRMFFNGQRKLPLVFRADSTDLEQFIDFQVGLRGLGYIYALRKIMDKYFETGPYHNFERLSGLLSVFIKNLKADAQRITFYPMPWNPPEIDYFLKEMFLGGAARSGRLPKVLFSPERSNGSVTRQLCVAPRDFYKHFRMGRSYFWNTWLQKIFLGFLLDAAGKHAGKESEVEPPPNLLLEQKTILALVRDEKFRGYFTRQEKAIFPETYIIRKGLKMQFDGKALTLQDIVDMPRPARSYIIKYAGLDFRINWGGRAVYRIRNLSKASTANIIRKAALSYEKYKEPWVLQKEVSCRENIEYLDTDAKLIKTGKMYKLYRPYFIYMADRNDIELLDIMLIFRDNFKVHAKTDCVIGLASIRE